MDNKMRPANQLYDVIELQDPNSNRIGQWLNETSNSRILQLSYSLDTEAREGPYQIIVSMGERKISHNFKVEKYVLPKYDVTLNISEEVLIGQEDIEAEVCAKYTYGQPVPGRVTVNVCRPINRYSSFGISLYDYELMALSQMRGSCHTETKQADKTGCATFSFNMSIFTKMDEKLQDVLDIRAKVEEEGTGVSLPQEKRVTISYVLGKVSFINMPKVWERGSNVEGKVRAVYHNNTPVCDAPVYLFTGQLWQTRSLQNLTTDSNGVASFSFNTDNFDQDIQLHASLTPTLGYPGYRTAHYDRGFHTLSMFQPSSPYIKTISSLEVQKKDKPLPCDEEEDISVNYTIVGESPGSVDVIYLVLSRGAVIMQGQTQVQVQDRSVTEGQVSFKVRVSPEMSPEFQLVAYAVLPSEDVIAHSANFSTDKCFSNKVSVEFSPSSAVPGEETNMQVTALPRSLCGVSAIDKSVLIKEPGKTLDADKIFDLLPLKKSSYIPYEVDDATECLNVRPKRYVLSYPSQEQNDAYAVFQKVGLKMATNLIFRLPSCLKFKGKFYHDGPHVAYAIALDYGPRLEDDPIHGLSSPGLGSAVQLPPPIETARSFFPETWIWDLVEVGDDGKRDVSLTVPDTITTWETETFCLSSQGFGLAPRKEMKVFQPFFLELTMPYSIIRGEHFELKATVFNYLTSCIMVTVTPGPSSDYTLKPLSGDLYTSCLCANKRKTLRWTMIPTALDSFFQPTSCTSLHLSHVTQAPSKPPSSSP
ncbi:alpha-2-macroglobulin-like [Oreochromis aureus]|uniref:alpha-2-macroglobulin-like n=1 Tax=Oreochromis aureus TaxID=47969 RepID=UPI001954DB92|nr:alpha-2-macroglobulin-like [Oreochromis aureus]